MEEKVSCLAMGVVLDIDIYVGGHAHLRLFETLVIENTQINENLTTNFGRII